MVEQEKLGDVSLWPMELGCWCVLHMEMQMEMQLLGWREEPGTTDWGSAGTQGLRVVDR